MALSLTPFPLLQFTNDDGTPLVGGTLATYQPGTFTKVTTYQDIGGNTANQNPMTFDSGAWATIYSDGRTRWIVKRPDGTTLYDSDTDSYLPSDAISDAMLPVVGAATLATARSLMGIDADIAAAISAIELMPGPTGATGATGATGPQGSTGPTGGGYQPTVYGGNPGAVQFPNGNGQLNVFIQGGNAVTGSNGLGNISFPQAFPTGCITVVATCQIGNIPVFVNVTGFNSTSFSACSWNLFAGGGDRGGATPFSWMAWGY